MKIYMVSLFHRATINKIKSHGIGGVLLDWIADFLSERLHSTRLGNVLSSPRCIRSGVIQGSCPGPLLFLVYINDLMDVFTADVNCKLYADDVKLYAEVRSSGLFSGLFRFSVSLVTCLAAADFMS